MKKFQKILKNYEKNNSLRERERDCFLSMWKRNLAKSKYKRIFFSDRIIRRIGDLQNETSVRKSRSIHGYYKKNIDMFLYELTLHRFTGREPKFSMNHQGHFF